MAQISIEQLRQIITTSEVLTPAEKQEWGRLVEFMNDKQLLDLYKILSSAIGTSPAVAPQPSAQPEIVPISQSSLPKVEQTVAQQPLRVGEGASLSSFLHRAAEQTDSPLAQKPAVSQSPSTAMAPALAEKIKPEPLVNIDATELVATPEQTVSVLPAPQEAQAVVVEPLLQQEQAEYTGITSVRSLTDAANVGVDTLRTMGVKQLYEDLRTLSKHKGYFDLLFAFEKSPVYAAYVHTGLKLISGEVNAGVEGSVGGDTLLTKQEFEDMTDMMKTLGAA